MARNSSNRDSVSCINECSRRACDSRSKLEKAAFGDAPRNGDSDINSEGVELRTGALEKRCLAAFPEDDTALANRSVFWSASR